MTKTQKVSFAQFLAKFPQVELPITLSDDLHHTFSQNNDPFNAIMIQQIIEALDDEESDELTEYIPCFQIPETHEFHAVVFWKAGLMNYQYIMATFTKKGKLIDKRVIAGTYSDGKIITRSVATIDPDWVIYVVTGQTDGSDTDYDAGSSKAFELELLPDGQIVNSI